MSETSDVHAPPPSSAAPEHLTRATGQLIDAATVRRVFGDPIERGDRTVIPMASIEAMVGFGSGSGGQTAPDGGGSGSGVGGRTQATPVGAIELDADGVHIHFSPNVTARIVVTIALVVAWNAFWALYTIRRTRQQQAISAPGA
ncbi:MAG: hypothetical protein IT340_16010 [Chloroflexi bacterium]|nr:hypothetical protein [Chloroflexota bacterium]